MSTKVSNGLALEGQRITGVGDPTLAGDAATKGYVDLFVNGITLKNPVRVTTTANITLSAPQTIDGVSVIAGNRVLVKNQTLGQENGIYVVAAGAWARATDADVSAEVVPGMTVFVLEGATQADRQFSITSDAAITLGTTVITFGQTASSGGATLTAGNGISLPGNAITVVPLAGGGLTVAAGGVGIDPTYSGLARRFSVNVPNSATATITHNLGTLDVVAMVREISGGAVVIPDINVTTVNELTLTFATAPGVGALRVTVVA